jgi:hypothetical protein
MHLSQPKLLETHAGRHQPYPSKLPLLGIAVAATVFSKELCSISIQGSQVDIFQLLVAAYGLLIWRPEIQNWIGYAAVFAVWNAAVLLINDFPMSTFIKQTAAASFIYVGIASVVASVPPVKLWHCYLRVCTWCAAFGLVQIALSAAGFHFLIKVPMRLDSLTYEPSHYVVAVGPALFYYISRFRLASEWRSLALLLLSVVATLSATGLALLGICALLTFYRKSGVLIIAVAIIVWMVTPPLSELNFTELGMPETIESRLTSMQEYLQSEEDSGVSDNLTVLSFTTNYEVAMSTFKEGRCWGNGFCGHASAYHEHFLGDPFMSHERYGINSIPAHCLGIRIISEFGLFGIMLFAWLVSKPVTGGFHPRRIWASAFLIAFLLRCVKLGSLVDYGFPLFVVAAVIYSHVESE